MDYTCRHFIVESVEIFAPRAIRTTLLDLTAVPGRIRFTA